jgi:hypothetical protein
LANILPGLSDLDPALSPEEQISRAVESNVRWTVHQILDSPEGKSAHGGGTNEDRWRGLRDRNWSREIPATLVTTAIEEECKGSIQLWQMEHITDQEYSSLEPTMSSA